MIIDGNGVSFRDFAMRCARAMGACVTMRDDPMDAPIRTFESSDYHAKAAAEERERMRKLEAMTEEDAERASLEDYQREVERINGYNREKEENRWKYEAMLSEVMGWEPPTPDHVGMKEFMAKQIRDSIQWDCSPYEDRPRKIDGKTWLRQQKQQCSKSIVYHATEQEAEESRTKARNEWVAQLVASLDEKGKED